MVQISITDALYRQLQTTAQKRGVSVETYIQETLEGADSVATPLQLQDERNLFDALDQLAQQNGAIPSEEWSKLVSEMRD